MAEIQTAPAINETLPSPLSKPLLLTSEQILQKAKSDFTQELGHGDFTESDLEKYTKEHVGVIRIGNIDAVVINEEHNEFSGTLNPVLQAYISNQKTKVVGVEYFTPELESNSAYIPVIGKLLDFSFKKRQKKAFIGDFFDKITEQCRAANKPIAVSDIANNLAYLFNLGTPLALSFIPTPLRTLIAPVAFPAIAGTLTGAVQELLSQFNINKGMFDKDKLHKSERLMLYAEDARRLFAAKGIEKLVEKYQPQRGDKSKPNEEPNPQVVFVYPKAHVLRIRDYLQDHEGLTHKTIAVKKALYRLMPGLDYNVRIYECRDKLAKLSGNPNIAIWSQEEKIPF